MLILFWLKNDTQVFDKKQQFCHLSTVEQEKSKNNPH